jgi:hypothetical protein
MVANSFLAGIKGDSTKPNHREALIGNAMVFNTSRWVQLTSGVDSLPMIANQTPFTAVFVGETFAYNGIPSGGGFFYAGELNTVEYNTVGRFINGIRLFVGGLLDVANNTTLPTSTVRYQLSVGAPLGQKNILFATFAGNLPPNVPFFIQGRKEIANQVISGGGNATVINPIGIGRVYNYPASVTMNLRSIEVLFRVLNDVELRKVFNYGTAHSAGLITAQDISIDFNRINGQAPICRTGSRQLTVTPMNNTTPDTAGTTYIPFL